MDNILYIGPYREFSGMGNASRQYIKALIASGNNISIRPIYNYYTAFPEENIHNDILALEKNNSYHYHKIIQHCYPHQMVFNSKFDEHIGLIHLESINNTTIVKEHLDILDKIIVGSSFIKRELNNLKIQAKIMVIPEPIDIDEIIAYRDANPIEIENDNYKFYTISSFCDKKNLQALLISFLIFSNHYSDTDLIIKLRHIDHAADMQQYIEYEFEKIYSMVRNNFVKKPKIYIGNTSYENVLHIHNSNDCYINTSHGESFGYSALEAMCFNNNIIVTENSGFDDIIDNNCGFKVASDLIPCKDKERIFPIYNSIYQKWYEPRIDDLIDKMIMAINEPKLVKKERILAQKNKAKNFSIHNIANMFKNI